jgi:hypothetical protein
VAVSTDPELDRIEAALVAAARRIEAEQLVRRRWVGIAAVAVVALALMSATAVANGWLLRGTSALRAAPALGSPAADSHPSRDLIPGAAGLAHGLARSVSDPGVSHPRLLGVPIASLSRTLLSHLGPRRRTLRTVVTSTGGVCLEVSGFGPQCLLGFGDGQPIVWFDVRPSSSTTIIYGIARAGVEGVDAIDADGTAHTATLGNDAFYLELPDLPAYLRIHLSGGGTATEHLPQCPATTPACGNP